MNVTARGDVTAQDDAKAKRHPECYRSCDSTSHHHLPLSAFGNKGNADEHYILSSETFGAADDLRIS